MAHCAFRAQNASQTCVYMLIFTSTAGALCSSLFRHEWSSRAHPRSVPSVRFLHLLLRNNLQYFNGGWCFLVGCPFAPFLSPENVRSRFLAKLPRFARTLRRSCPLMTLYENNQASNTAPQKHLRPSSLATYPSHVCSSYVNAPADEREKLKEMTIPCEE